jgi:hypothetical protein
VLPNGNSGAEFWSQFWSHSRQSGVVPRRTPLGSLSTIWLLRTARNPLSRNSKACVGVTPPWVQIPPPPPNEDGPDTPFAGLSIFVYRARGIWEESAVG